MSKVERFEDLICWQAARELNKLVYSQSRTGPIWRDFNMRDQVRSAGLSTMSNIAEGFGKLSDRDFIRFLEMSTTSANEVKSISYASEDLNYWTEEVASQIRNSTEKVKALNLGLIRYLRKRNRKR